MPLDKTRLAISVYFFVSGFLYANWTARVPELQAYFAVDNAALGVLLFFVAFGGIVGLPASGGLSARFGSAPVARAAAVLVCLALPMVVVSDSWVAGCAGFFAMGLGAGTLDVAMNAQAILLGRRRGKTAMAFFHGVFSVGTALGAGAGALFAKWGWALQGHFAAVAAASLALSVVAMASLLAEPKRAVGEGAGARPVFLLPVRSLLPLGVVAFCGMVGEGAMADWSALYMHQVLGQGEYASALAFGAFATAMTLGRLFGDLLIARVGTGRLLLANASLAFASLAVVLAATTPGVALAGFFGVGLGLATLVPIVYAAAGNAPGVAPSTGIAMASTIGYSGFFIGPPIIGFLADGYGLRVGFCFALLLLAVMLALVWRGAIRQPPHEK